MKPRIMIVEDESIVAHDIQRTLQLYGYDIFSIESSGESALKRFESEHPDLVLMDIVLKGQIDGVEAARQIHLLYGVPVIFITSQAEDTMIEQAKKTEPFGYIIKPFQDRELKTIVEMSLYKARMEHILREREEWLSVTLNSIGDGVIATDSLGKIFLINPIAEKILAVSRDKVIGEPIEKFFICKTGDAAAPDENPVLSVIRDGMTIHSALDTLLFRSDGGVIPIDFRITRIESARGYVMGAVMVFKDITETRKIQSELLKVQKLESIGRLAGGIAHEFNNVLTAVLGNISLGKIFTEGSGEMYDCLNEAEKASLRARDLAQKLMIFSKGGSPVKETASIIELIEESAEFALEGTSVKCNFNLPLSLWQVEVDVNQMNQVISNVILNASEAMGGAGVVQVRAENFRLDNTTSSLAEGHYVKIEIADFGTGIPTENLSQLFDPYFSTGQPGKGMGLAICYSIIKRHGGHIDVESEMGKGTVVTIFVPASSKEMAGRADSRERETDGMPGNRVLFLDDKEMVRKSAVRILSRLGYEVECVKDGREAVELYSRSIKANKVFNAVILDLTIPGGMGGKECIAILKQLDDNVNAIASSGYSEDSVIADYKAYGFKGYLVKPYDVNQLKSVLNRVIHEPLSAVQERE
ncbi:MAG: response regulator [Vulcanimicrobiota bacterium]